MTKVELSKFQLRKYYRGLRRQLPLPERRDASQAAAHHLVQQAIFKQSEHIACYLYVNGEFNASPIIEAIWQAKKHCYLPVLAEGEDAGLIFAEYREGDILRPNRYSILEPVNVSRVIQPESLDLVIAPLVSYDLHGHRLGTGGGYYDRTFAFRLHQAYQKPFILGLGFEIQQANILPVEPWDITLDGVLTEIQFQLFTHDNQS